MNEVTLKLDRQKFEYILNVLAQRPFVEVNALLQDMIQQANAGQVNPHAASDNG